jgi:hypothetical protein
MNPELGPIFIKHRNTGVGSSESFFISKGYHMQTQNKFFLELGASNGIIQSNTKTLEDKFGWSGILIEGNDVLFNDLKLTRPNCILSNSVVYNADDKEVMFDERCYKEDIPNSEYLGNSKINEKKNIFSTKKKTKTLKTVLQENSCSRTIGFMVVDVEDSFLEVLQGMDFKSFFVEFISVEIGLHKNMVDAFNLLLSNNFVLIGSNNAGPDFYFINNSLL